MISIMLKRIGQFVDEENESQRIQKPDAINKTA